jgi:transitional endoplasmic reticulum ATPase
LDELVTRTEGFSPADIEHAAQKASQSALERALVAGMLHDPADVAGPTTEDFVVAISETRATVSADTAASFLVDIGQLART